MKVLIRGKLYDALEEPIVLILDKEDKTNISSMSESARRYMAYPKGMAKIDIDNIVEKARGL